MADPLSLAGEYIIPCDYDFIVDIYLPYNVCRYKFILRSLDRSTVSCVFCKTFVYISRIFISVNKVQILIFYVCVFS